MKKKRQQQTEPYDPEDPDSPVFYRHAVLGRLESAGSDTEVLKIGIEVLAAIADELANIGREINHSNENYELVHPLALIEHRK